MTKRPLRTYAVLTAAAVTLTCLSLLAADLLDYRVDDIDGNPVDLDRYRGKVVLAVNVASLCGYTSQYKGLQELHRRYADKGLAIVAFPANDFGNQEPGSNDEIQSFCLNKYGVRFDLMSKISVAGPEKHPFYRALTGDPEFGGEVRWNFEKFLIGRDARIRSRVRSGVEPLSGELIEAVEQELAR